MSNMPYCRFQNTAHDLRDCAGHILDADLSIEEQAARVHLVRIAIDLLQELCIDVEAPTELTEFINDAVRG